MHDRCSPAVHRAIESALIGASPPGSHDVVPARLLLGLIAEEDGRATSLLVRHGIEINKLRQELESSDSATCSSIDNLVAEARALSREHEGEGTATSEYFLLAIVRADAELRRRLVTLGLDASGLENAILGDESPVLPMNETIHLPDPADTITAGRILDVNANRAREALRILDDFARFVLADPLLTREIKQLRHDLVEMLQLLPERFFLGSRDTIQDVGTTIATAGEMTRVSPRDIAQVNWKRLQEALRSLEEYGKLFGPAPAEGFERIRYRSYTLEKAILLGESARRQLEAARLYVLLSGSDCVSALDWTIEESAAAGASVFQLREKELDDRRLLERARDVRRWTRQVNALFIMNDRPDIARLVEADGVHLGQEDMSVNDARRILGPDALIGVSTHTLEQVRNAVLDGASYIGVGPAFPSTTKQIAQISGLKFIEESLAETSLPAFAIGGVKRETIDSIVAVGARRVAVSAAVIKADDPRQAARTLLEALPR